MTPANISLVNAVILIVIGLWGYFGAADPSKTAFIPVAFGAILLVLNSGLRKHNKVIAHIAVGLTLVILIGLIMPLKGAIGRSDNMAIYRVIVMMASCLLAMIVFVKSFIDARRNKPAESAK